LARAHGKIDQTYLTQGGVEESERRPFTDPDTAARKLIEIANGGSISGSG
jgi:hypothetical protein